MKWLLATVLSLAVITAAMSQPGRPEHEVQALARQLDDLERDRDRRSAAIDSAAQAVARLTLRTDAVVRAYAETETRYERAGVILERARQTEDFAALRSEEVVKRLEATAKLYRYATYAVVATAALAQAVCATKMSTHEFRTEQRMYSPSTHVDHLWPQKYGGFDHPLNYQPWPAAKNLSCGAGCLGEKATTAPLSLALGIAVSVLGQLGCP